MAVFDFDKVDEYVQNERGTLNFFKLADDGYQAKVRFMYGPGEIFQGYSVHNVSKEPGKNKFIPCLREPGQPLDVCPLCAAGVPTMAQYFIPLFVISTTKCINGVLQQEEPINQVLIFQRGKTFKGSLESAIRQSKGTPLVSNVFNIVRSGKAGNTDTKYMVEHLSNDNTTLDMLPERPEIVGSFLLPNVTYEEMYSYIPQQPVQGIQPRVIQTQTAVPNQYGTSQYTQAPTRPPF